MTRSSDVMLRPLGWISVHLLWQGGKNLDTSPKTSRQILLWCTLVLPVLCGDLKCRNLRRGEDCPTRQGCMLVNWLCGLKRKEFISGAKWSWNILCLPAGVSGFGCWHVHENVTPNAVYVSYTCWQQENSGPKQRKRNDSTNTGWLNGFRWFRKPVLIHWQPDGEAIVLKLGVSAGSTQSEHDGSPTKVD